MAVSDETPGSTQSPYASSSLKPAENSKDVELQPKPVWADSSRKAIHHTPNYTIEGFQHNRFPFKVHIITKHTNNEDNNNICFCYLHHSGS